MSYRMKEYDEYELTFERFLSALVLDAARTPYGDTYGVRFHNRWRTSDRGVRHTYRFLHRLPRKWDPPGYPSVWD